MSRRIRSKPGSAAVATMEAMEQRLMLAVDPYSGMSITADTTFNAGTFTINQAITIDADNVTVTGAGHGSTIILLAANDANGTNVFEIDDQEHVTIQDLTIDGNAANQGTWQWSYYRHWEGILANNCDYTTIQDVTVENMGDNGILIESGSTTITNTDNHEYDSTLKSNGHLDSYHKACGVWMCSSDDSSIERTTSKNNGYHGLGTAGDNANILDSFSYDNLQGGFVINGGTNSFINNCVGDGNGAGVGLYSAVTNAANTVSYCTLTNSVTNGIGVLDVVTDPAYANVIENNTISGCGATGAGVYSSGGDYHIIRNNVLTNMGGYGVFVNFTDNATITGNSIAGADSDAIRAEGGDNVTVTGNTVTSSTNGIQFAGTTKSGHLITDNTVTTTGHGIMVSGQNNVTISGNSITGPGSTNYGMYLYYVNNSTGGEIRGNAITGYQKGMYLLINVDNIDIIDNYSYSNGIGLQLYDADNNYVYGNKLTSNTSYDIYESNSTGNTGRENIGTSAYNWNDIDATGFTYTATHLFGDYDEDADVDDEDIDMLAAAVRATSSDYKYDLDRDGDIDSDDHTYIVTTTIGTRMGDADLDGDVDQADYDAWDAHDGDTGHTVVGQGWSWGDFDGDGDGDSADEAIWTANSDGNYLLHVNLNMNESGGTIAYDSTSFDNDATLAGDASFIAGMSGGNALDFDGTGDYAVITNSTSTTIDDNITIAFWVKGSSQPDYHRLVCNRTQTGGDGFDINVQSGSDDVTIRVDTSGGTNQTFTIANVLDGTWHHLAYTLDTGTIACYLDGTQVTTVNTSYTHGNGFGNTNDWVLAADTNHNQCFDGTFDDFRLYNTALSSSAIDSIYDELA